VLTPRLNENPAIMGITLSIAALGILALVVADVSRWVRKQRPEGSGGSALSTLVSLFLVIFALVSLSVSSQLAESSSGIAKLLLFLFIVANAVLVRASWTSTEAH
jgi:hypothetical protein